MIDVRKVERRHVIIALAALAGVFGELVAAVSTTRIAGPAAVAVGETAGRLGLPYDLRWTLFGVVSVAGWVGAILWTSRHDRDRRIGPWLNLPAATAAGAIVGLDHAVHADPSGPWPFLAFATGPVITLTSSAMLHVVSGMRARVSDVGTPEPSVGRSGDVPAVPLVPEPEQTYEPDEDAGTTEEPTPVGAGQAAVDRQIEWINTREVEPTTDEIVREFGMSERTAFRRLGAARRARGAA